MKEVKQQQRIHSFDQKLYGINALNLLKENLTPKNHSKINNTRTLGIIKVEQGKPLSCPFNNYEIGNMSEEEKIPKGQHKLKKHCLNYMVACLK